MRIAITGGIAEGKSTVLKYLAELGYETASVDEIAREVFLRPDVQSELPSLIGQERPLTPLQVSEKLLASADVRRAINRVMHPRIAVEMGRSSATFLEVPILVETCLHPLFDRVWVVTCGPDEQVLRLSARVGQETAARFIATQLSSFGKTPFADLVVRTNAEPETVKRFVKQEAKVALFS